MTVKELNEILKEVRKRKIKNPNKSFEEEEELDYDYYEYNDQTGGYDGKNR